ncbi:unnamed protein product, partial [Mycena citricolor]
DIRTHRLAAIVQSVVLNSFKRDLSEWEKLLGIFDDEDWFRSVLGIDNNDRTRRPSAQQVYECACVGVVTTFLEQCTARSPNQTERELDFDTLNKVYAFTGVIPPELQRRFANAVSAFIRKYPENCFADGSQLSSVLFWAVVKGWMHDADALRVVDTAVSKVQTDNQQRSHRDRAQALRGCIQNGLRPENIPAESVLLVNDWVWEEHDRGCHFPLI